MVRGSLFQFRPQGRIQNSKSIIFIVACNLPRITGTGQILRFVFFGMFPLHECEITRRGRALLRAAHINLLMNCGATAFFSFCAATSVRHARAKRTVVAAVLHLHSEQIVLIVKLRQDESLDSLFWPVKAGSMMPYNPIMGQANACIAKAPLK